MQQRYITYHQSIIHYMVAGKGSKLLFCFHGYGENCDNFSALQPLLAKGYTIAAIDFPLHGKTEWKHDDCLKPDALIEIMQQIQTELGFNNDSKINLMGYSMGGRAALHIISKIPQQIEKVILIAPDGLHKNFWYYIATQTLFGNKLFKYTMHNPQWLFALMKAARKAGLLNKSVYKFASHYLDDTEARNLLYKRWTLMRRFTPQLEEINKAISDNNIAVRFLFGSYDRIILSKRSKIFADNSNIKIEEINDGHKLITEKNAEKIVSLLYD